MNQFLTRRLPDRHDVLAPDGSEVRILIGLDRGGMAHFQLPAGQTSLAVTHRTVGEIWYTLSGCGELWRRQADREEIVSLEPGICVTIPLGTHFQFRAAAAAPLQILGVTMPPWPGPDEAVVVQGKWEPTVGLSGFNVVTTEG
jgi:mannose-6-phosphate isomerase-like protein (cupin superfamily)